MRLFAALVPPRHVLEELESVVRATATAGPGGHRGEARRSLIGRLSGLARGDHGSSTDDQLDATPVTHLHIPITNFGNLTLGDSVKLADELRADVATWPRPELHFAGGTALEWPGDESVWAKLAGDVERLKAIGRGVPPVAQRLHLFVDRRQFRPWLALGTITDSTTAPYLEDLVARLERFQGRSWVQDHVSLLRGIPSPAPGEVPFEEVEKLPLAEA